MITIIEFVSFFSINILPGWHQCNTIPLGFLTLIFLWNHWIWCSLCVAGLPLVVNAVITSCLVGFWFFLIKIYVRRYLLRGLLSYRGWMCEYSGNRYLCSSSCLHRSWKRILIKWLAWRLANKQKKVIEKNENWIFWWIYNSLFLVLFSLNKVVSIACEGL